MRIEHEYAREGMWTYLAAWDVHRANVFGRYEPKGTIASFDRFVGEVMRRKPYRTAKRVFWIVDNAGEDQGRVGSVACGSDDWHRSQSLHATEEN